MTAKGSVFVIGSGAAGQGAARALARSGWDVTVADHGKIGGTCLWHGCMPKKALYHAARVRREDAAAETFGLGVCSPEYDWQAVLAWKWHAQETYAGDQEAILTAAGAKLVKATATFLSPDEIECDGVIYRPDHVVVATGSRSVVPDIPGATLADFSDDALGYPDPPSSLLIIGAGFIGMEFAAIYSAFGTRVTVVSSAPRPLEMLDEDTSKVAVTRLARAGVHFLNGCRLTALEGSRGSIAAHLHYEGDERVVHAERVLMAVGRSPALDGLGLESAAVETDAHGRVVVDAHLRTTNPRVWVAGDASGGLMQTPVASYEGSTIAASIDSGIPVTVDCSTVPTCCFTDPQLAQVGMTEHAAAAAGIAYHVGTTSFDTLGAAVVDDERDGLVKLLFSSADDRLIGAHIAGPTASDLIWSMALALRCEATSATLRSVPGIHPGYCEAIPWAAY